MIMITSQFSSDHMSGIRNYTQTSSECATISLDLPMSFQKKNFVEITHIRG